MRRPTRSALLLICSCILLACRGTAQAVPIDATQSTLTVNVFKTGVFSAFGDEHIVRAPISRGEVVQGPQPSVTLTVQTAQMAVLDPKLAPEKRAKVQEQMLSDAVLAPKRFPEIVFRSTNVQANGAGRWIVRGDLTLHGVTQQLSFEVTETNGRYLGKTRFKQTQFKIEPPGIPGGFVKAKDEVEIVWDIVPAH